MSLYTQMRAEVGAAFTQDLGAVPVVFRRYASTSDLVEGTVATTLAMSQTLYCLILPASGGTLEAFDVRFMDGAQDDTNVRFALASGLGATFVPGPKDRAVLYNNGVEWHVMGCTPVNIDGASDIIYSIGFRLP